MVGGRGRGSESGWQSQARGKDRELHQIKYKCELEKLFSHFFFPVFFFGFVFGLALCTYEKLNWLLPASTSSSFAAQKCSLRRPSTVTNRLARMLKSQEVVKGWGLGVRD